jgi:hypothetical protein
MFCQKGQKKGYLLKKSLICDSANSMIKNRTRQGEVFVEIFRKSVETSSEDPKVSQFLQRSQHSNAPLNHSYKSYQLFFYKLWTFSILLFLILKQSKILQDSETPPPPPPHSLLCNWLLVGERMKGEKSCLLWKIRGQRAKVWLFSSASRGNGFAKLICSPRHLKINGSILPWKNLKQSRF